MGSPQLGLIVLGFIVATLGVLAIVVHYGKKYYEEEQANKQD